MPRGRAHRLERHFEARPGNLPGIDCPTDRNRLVAASHIAGTRESLLQHLSYEYGGIERAVDVRMRQPVLGAVGAIREQRRDMDVAVDETGQDRCAREIDHACTGWRHVTVFN